MVTRLKEKLQVPEQMPELYDEKKVEEERDLI